MLPTPYVKGVRLGDDKLRPVGEDPTARISSMLAIATSVLAPGGRRPTLQPVRPGAANLTAVQPSWVVSGNARRVLMAPPFPQTATRTLASGPMPSAVSVTSSYASSS